MFVYRWHSILNGLPVELGLRMDLANKEIVMLVDGFPFARRRFPATFHPWVRYRLTVEGKEVCFLIVPQFGGLSFYALVEGFCCDTNKTEERLLGDAPRYSQPSQLWFNIIQYARCFPARFSMMLVGFALSLGALTAATLGVISESLPTVDAVGLGAAGAIGLIALIAQLRSHIISLSLLFQFGTAVPAMTLPGHPNRLILLLEVGQADSRERAIVITEQPLWKAMSSEVPERFRTIAVVASPGKGSDDVSPVAALCGSTDTEAIEHLLQSFPNETWTVLETSWALAGRPRSPGYYPCPVP